MPTLYPRNVFVALLVLFVGSRLLLLSDAGVLSTFTGAPGPGQFLAYGG